jgi:DNA-binding response OmpR family regulator
MRLLLVEDDPMIGESLEEGLRGERYAVDWAPDGRRAELAACRESRGWRCSPRTASAAAKRRC